MTQSTRSCGSIRSLYPLLKPQEGTRYMIPNLFSFDDIAYAFKDRIGAFLISFAFIVGVLACIVVGLVFVVISHLTDRGQGGFELEVCNHKRWSEDIKRFRDDIRT